MQVEAQEKERIRAPIDEGDRQLATDQISHQRLEDYLESWLESEEFGYIKISPRVYDGKSGYRGVDAMASAPNKGLCVVNLWWHDQLPSRSNSGLLERDFDGHKVYAPDPVEGLARFMGPIKKTMSKLGLTGISPRTVLLLPFVDDEEELAAAKELWPEFDGELVAPLLGGSLSVGEIEDTQAGWKRFWTWVLRHPGEELQEEEVQAELETIHHEATSLIRRWRSEQEARPLEEKYQGIGKEPLTVALLGTFSSGKTSLVNGITGPYLFPVNDLPTTANKVAITWGETVRAEVVYHDVEYVRKLKKTVKKLAASPVKDPFGLERRRVKTSHPCVGKTEVITDWERLSSLITDNDEAIYIRDMHVELPIPYLKGYRVVDLPGTDSHIPWHKRITTQAVTGVDVVLFLFRGGQPFSRKDKELLDLISPRKNLSDDSQFLFVVNKIDQVQKRERPAALARIEGELVRHFAIDRPQLLQACMFLADFTYQHEIADEDDKKLLQRMKRKVCHSLGLSALETVDEHLCFSGLMDIGEFLARAGGEKEVTQVKSWLEAVEADVRSVSDQLARERSSLSRTLEELKKLQTTLESAKSFASQDYSSLLEDKTEVCKEKISRIYSQSALYEEWMNVIGRHTGKLDGTIESIRIATRDWITRAGKEAESSFEIFRTDILEIQIRVLDTLAKKLRSSLEEGKGEKLGAPDITPDMDLEEIGRRVTDWSEEQAGLDAKLGLEDLFSGAKYDYAVNQLFDGFSEKLSKQTPMAVSPFFAAMRDLIALVEDKLDDWFGWGREKRLRREKQELRQEFPPARAEETISKLRSDITEVISGLEELAGKEFESVLHQASESLGHAIETKTGNPAEVEEEKARLSEEIQVAGNILSSVASVLGRL